jgi:beta-lactamase superfamily II metal-dependent hydrolase
MNTYGHPCREVLKRFERRRIPVYRTDLDGAVGIYRDRKGRLRVCTVVPRENT